MLGELMAVVGLFNKTNKLAEAYQGVGIRAEKPSELDDDPSSVPTMITPRPARSAGTHVVR